MDDVPIRDESIRLGQFLKLANLIDSGSDAKELMIQGAVTVNGEVETRRGRQLVQGDVVRSPVEAGAATATTSADDPAFRVTPRAGPGQPGSQRTSSRSTTKIRVSPGSITPPAPRSPYAEVRRDDQPAAAADLHALHALVPAGDDLADAEAEVEGRAAVVRGVELLARGVGHADVVHRDGAAGGGLLAVTLGELGDLEVTGRRAVGEVDLRLVCTHGSSLSRPFRGRQGG